MWLGDRTRLTFLHEVGHIVDVEWLRQEHRKRFARILGKHPWPYCLDGRCGATAWTQETFATVYASCGYPARGRVGRRRGFWIDDAWIMRTHKHRAACQLIRYRGYRSLVFGERGSY
jgi:hypothetical protein